MRRSTMQSSRHSNASQSYDNRFPPSCRRIPRRRSVPVYRNAPARVFVGAEDGGYDLNHDHVKHMLAHTKWGGQRDGCEAG